MTWYWAMPATPAEQADPTVNPSGGPLGWIVADDMDVAIPNQTNMTQAEADALAAEMNAKE